MEENLGDARAWYVEVINLLRSKAFSPVETQEKRAAIVLLKNVEAFKLVVEPFEDLDTPVAVKRSLLRLCNG